MNRLPALLDHAAAHHGLVSRSDAARVGLDARQLRALVAQGVLQPIGRRVFRVLGSPSGAKQQLLAGCLDVGGVAATTSAAAQHGLSGFHLEPAQVLVLDRRRTTTSSLARIHRTTYLPPEHVVSIDGIPTLNVARTLFSLAAAVPEVPEAVVVAATEEAIRRRLAHEPWLRWMLELLRRPGRNGVTVFERVLDRVGGLPVTESWLESESLRIIGGAGLPLPEVQVRVEADGEFVARVDFGYPDTVDLIEVNGHGTHSTRAQLARDSARRRRLTAVGRRVWDFTYDEIVDTPEALLDTVRTILERASGRAS